MHSNVVPYTIRSMEIIRQKLSNLSDSIRDGLLLCKAVGYYASLLLFTLGFTLWFDFRPFGMICAAYLGIFWCCHCATLQLQKSARLDHEIAKLEEKLATLRASSPIKLCIWLTCVVFTIIASFHFLPWWFILATVLALAFFIKWKYEIKIVMNHESGTTQETQLELDVKDFLPEINEINQSLLKEIDEQCDDILAGAIGASDSRAVKNAAEQDEEMYLNMLIPEVNSNDFESAEHSGSSSDEMFCPERVAKTPSLERSTKTKVQDVGNAVREKHIEFKVSHFNANSSSDSDDNISRGLCFSNDDDNADGDIRQNEPRYDILSASSLAGNVLVKHAYKHIVDAATYQLHQAKLQQEAAVSSFEPQNVTFASIGNTARSMRLSTFAVQKNEDSTDEDVDSDFEILNSEELNNL